jgi:hypothetical protein
MPSSPTKRARSRETALEQPGAYDAYWQPDDFAGQDQAASLQRPSQPPAISNLYHYTTAAGLHGILSSGVLRASNFSFLNDATEFTYGRDVAKVALRNRLRANQDTATIKQLIERSLQRVDERGAASEVYVTCFSTVGDLLSQWRAYGNASGRYCIQFNTAAMWRDLAPLSRFSIGAVLYSDFDQAAAAERVLMKFLGESPLMWDFSTRDVIDRGSTILADRLVRVAPLMKHAGFIEEAEWRAVAFNVDDEIEFDCTSGLLRPYMKLLSAEHFAKRRLPISKIIVGAVQHHAQAIKAARLLADKYGYRDVEVTGSNIPFRG